MLLLAPLLFQVPGNRIVKQGPLPLSLLIFHLLDRSVRSGGERGAAANVRPVDPRQREVRDSDRSETEGFNK